jgi:DNA ligase 1
MKAGTINEAQMTLGEDWAGEDLTGWILTEKFDGCRAYWDGAHLWTRGGRQIKAPASFTAGLPARHLDCELFAGYDRRAVAMVAAVHHKFAPDLRLVVFDAPQTPGNYLERLASLSVEQWPAHVQVVQPRRCAGNAAAAAERDAIQDAGGEGLMARNPNSAKYETGRTRNLLKVK